MGVRCNSFRGLLDEVFYALIPGRMMHQQDRRTPIPVGLVMEGREVQVFSTVRNGVGGLSIRLPLILQGLCALPAGHWILSLIDQSASILRR